MNDLFLRIVTFSSSSANELSCDYQTYWGGKDWTALRTDQ